MCYLAILHEIANHRQCLLYNDARGTSHAGKVEHSNKFIKVKMTSFMKSELLEFKEASNNSSEETGRKEANLCGF